jgi:hypothetical protein
LHLTNELQRRSKRKGSGKPLMTTKGNEDISTRLLWQLLSIAYLCQALLALDMALQALKGWKARSKVASNQFSKTSVLLGLVRTTGLERGLKRLDTAAIMVIGESWETFSSQVNRQYICYDHTHAKKRYEGCI